MSSAGDAIDKLCHIVRLTMEIRGTDLDGAVAELGPVVPDGMTDKLRQCMLHDSTVLLRPASPTVLSGGGPQDWGITTRPPATTGFVCAPISRKRWTDEHPRSTHWTPRPT
ncbi:hypothetical protein FB459_1945 [Yimella lutea]|uniref:Uncharacterized protein n=1 Tax=Yimella lutea TaxID=587872 RepID=A0A542EGN2_9MICO|nr:hypothetical protein FB459_1945 [Yimella lutea]